MIAGFVMGWLAATAVSVWYQQRQRRYYRRILEYVEGERWR